MNHIINDNGRSIIAIGSQGSIERCRSAYPKLISQLDALYCDSADASGRAVDKAIELIRSAGVRSELETNSILACSLYARERPGSVADLVMSMRLIGRVATQCIDPRSGKTGDWLFSGDNHRDPSSAISPLFPDYVGLVEWCKANGWTAYGYDYVNQSYSNETTFSNS